MSAEIVEAVRLLGREKGISEEKLMGALEDALLSAYKKQPGAARYARVRMDRDSGDFIVEEFMLTPELEDQLLDEAEEQATGALERRVDPETGEVIVPEAPDIDPGRLSDFEDQIELRDVTPDDFGRIAAQTAKQVILQRIREAERDMMFEEYRDRVGELITGIVQQSDSRYTLVQLRERVEALLPKSEQVDGERYDHSQRIKAVIKEVSPATKGPAIIVSRRDPELIKKLFELEVPEIAAEEAEHGYEEEEVQGRCAAILSNGRRCPNAALPGSRYCGLELHQALAAIDSDNVVDLASEGEPQAGAAEAQDAAPQARAAAHEQPPAPADQPPAEALAAAAPDVAPDAGLEAAAETELGDGSQPAAHLGADVSEVAADGTGASEAAAEQAPQAAEASEPVAGEEPAAEPTAEGLGA